MGERSGIAPIHSQLLKQHNNNAHFTGLPWPSSPSSAFYAHFARPHSTTRPNDMHILYHIQQPTDWHLLAVQIGPRPMWTRQHMLQLMLAHLLTRRRTADVSSSHSRRSLGQSAVIPHAICNYEYYERRSPTIRVIYEARPRQARHTSTARHVEVKFRRAPYRTGRPRTRLPLR